MKLSLRWYSTNYAEGLHTYYYILSVCPTQVSVNLIDGLSINRLFDSSKYLTTLRSNISPRQKARKFTLLPLYNENHQKNI